MSRKSKFLALISMSFLLAILLPAAAFAAPGNDISVSTTLTTQATLDAPSDITAKATANNDGTFNLRIDYTGGAVDSGKVNVTLWDGRTQIDIEPDYSTYSCTEYSAIPGKYAEKTLTIKLFNKANAYSVFTDSRTVTKTVVLPSAVIKPTSADLATLAKKSVSTSKTKYGSTLKKGEKITWKSGLHTVTVKVTKVTSGSYELQATITTASKVREVYEGSSYPESYYFNFQDSTLNGEKYEISNLANSDFSYELSDENMKSTMTVKLKRIDCAAGWNDLAFKIASYGGNVKHDGTALGEKTYHFEFVNQPYEPAISAEHGAANKVTKNSIKVSLSGITGKVKYQYRKKGAKAWKSGTTKKSSLTIKKLKAGTAYQIRMKNIVTSKNRAGKSLTVESDWSPVKTILTAPSGSPKISSVSRGSITTSRTWMKGYWTSYSRSGVWIPGKWLTGKSYDVTIYLSSVPKGSKYYEVSYNDMTFTGKLKGKTIKFRGSGDSADVWVRTFANTGYENEMAGYSGWSNSKRISV